jgi:hypothetical protein
VEQLELGVCGLAGHRQGWSLGWMAAIFLFYKFISFCHFQNFGLPLHGVERGVSCESIGLRPVLLPGLKAAIFFNFRIQY